LWKNEGRFDSWRKSLKGDKTMHNGKLRILAGLLIALAFTGCGGREIPGASPAFQASGQAPVTPVVHSTTTPVLLTTATETTLVTERKAPLLVPAGLAVEEYALSGPPSFEPLSFTPLQGSMAGILARRSAWRSAAFPDNSFYDEMRFSMRADLGAHELIATQDYDPTGSDGWGIVKLNGEEIYRVNIGPGSPVTALRGLWVYDDHWVLETVHATLHEENNIVDTQAIGQISQDGELLNTRYGYDEMFGFQLMAGRPFYFFRQNGKLGFSYDGQVVAAGYDEIPHYHCCSSGALNPVRAMNMVAFFAQRENAWYYVEIGVYE
jgi:hypothetical protein